MPWNPLANIAKNLVRTAQLARRISRFIWKSTPKMLPEADVGVFEAHEALVEESIGGIDLLTSMSQVGSAVGGNLGCMVVLLIAFIVALIALVVIIASYPKPPPFRFDSSSEAAWIYDQRVPPIVRDKLEVFYRMLEERVKVSPTQKVEELSKELQDIGSLFAKDIPPDIPTGGDVQGRQAEIAWLRRRISEVIRSNGLQDLATSIRADTSDPDWEVRLQGQRLEASSRGDMAHYNRLLKEHLELYQQRGVDPCQSVFFPQGCY